MTSPGMTKTVLKLALLAVATILTAPACGSPANRTADFVGPWTFSSGVLTPVCTLSSVMLQPLSLQGLPVTFTKVDDSTISLETGTAGCTVLFSVSGGTATAKPGQTCMLDVPTLGPTSVGITSWTLTLSGDQIQSMLSGAVVICTASGAGVLVRGGGDASTTGGD
jgi:hypothetical protein